jgi:hypothetical protein
MSNVYGQGQVGFDSFGFKHRSIEAEASKPKHRSRSIEAEASKPKHRSRSIEATSKFQNLAISKFPF